MSESHLQVIDLTWRGFAFNARTDRYVGSIKGHVDHRISRANGGSNDYANLTWACAPCNWSKGVMNDTEFLDLLQ